jgi:glycine dehydrogenase subunit 1
MEMANASLYDGATALAEALIMAMTVTKRKRILLPQTVTPSYRRVAQTYLQGLPVELQDVPFENGTIHRQQLAELLTDDVAAIVVQQPNFLGCIEDVQALADAAHARGALLIVVFNPTSLGVLPPPGSYDADIAVAEGQPLGIASQFGGPGVGLFCCRKQYARFAPGRLVGQTTDEQGRVGYTLTLQTREQHIRREKATSNICTNQALCALSASIYLAAMGPQGLKNCATQCHHKAHYAARVLGEVPGCELAFATPFFHEFGLKLPRPVREVNRQLLQHGIIGGYDLGRDYPELQNTMLVCCTEKRTREEIDAFAEALKNI